MISLEAPSPIGAPDWPQDAIPHPIQWNSLCPKNPRLSSTYLTSMCEDSRLQRTWCEIWPTSCWRSVAETQLARTGQIPLSSASRSWKRDGLVRTIVSEPWMRIQIPLATGFVLFTQSRRSTAFWTTTCTTLMKPASWWVSYLHSWLSPVCTDVGKPSWSSQAVGYGQQWSRASMRLGGQFHLTSSLRRKPTSAPGMTTTSYLMIGSLESATTAEQQMYMELRGSSTSMSTQKCAQWEHIGSS